jgi:hypothetical protein
MRDPNLNIDLQQSVKYDDIEESQEYSSYDKAKPSGMLNYQTFTGERKDSTKTGSQLRN